MDHLGAPDGDGLGRQDHQPGVVQFDLRMMADSGARGSAAQIRQLAGMRGLMAKPGRFDHRDADHDELPRGPERPAVLHLDPRRPQRSGRHRAEDGELRLPDAPSRGRDAGSGSSRTTAAPERFRDEGPGLEGGEDRASARAHPRPRGRRADVVNPGYAGCPLPGRPARRGPVDRSRPGIDEVRRAHPPLTCETRYGLCASATPRPRPRLLVNVGEGGR